MSPKQCIPIKRTPQPTTWHTVDTTYNLPCTPFPSAPTQPALHRLRPNISSSLRPLYCRPSALVRVYPPRETQQKCAPARMTQLYADVPRLLSIFPLLLLFPFLALTQLFLNIGRLLANTTKLESRQFGFALGVTFKFSPSIRYLLPKHFYFSASPTNPLRE